MGKEKYRMYNLRRKEAPGNRIELSSVFEEINGLRNSIN